MRAGGWSVRAMLGGDRVQPARGALGMMARRGNGKSRRREGSAPPPAVRRFVEALTREERMLVVLKRELYEGSWDDMTADLRARLEGRPYIFKLANRITEDLQRIARLREFEDGQGVDLCDFVSLD